MRFQLNMYRELTTKRVAIVLALELAIVIALGVLYDTDTQEPDVVIKNESNTEEEIQVGGIPNTEIVGVGTEKDTTNESSNVPTEIDTSTEPDTSTEQEEPYEPELVLNENPLTGEFNLTDGAVGKRPVAVMINNVKKSMPQYGIAQADIIFEIPVEGFLTRFMAVYADYTQMPKICSIRSCRPYFPAIAKGFDAVYVYSGMAGIIRDYVNSLSLPMFEGSKNHGGLFGRDQARKDAGYKLEHTMYFDGTGMVQAMSKRKIRSDILEEYAGNVFLFQQTTDLIPPEGDACTWVETSFGAATATFTYDEKTGKYLKDFNGNPQIDGVVGTQLAFTNVFILETTITTAEYGTHKDVDWHGGKGYYISNGVVQKITWSKADEESPLEFWDVDGNELRINRGKSYIALNRKNRTKFK